MIITMWKRGIVIFYDSYPCTILFISSYVASCMLKRYTLYLQAFLPGNEL